jgi:hypothetical protein
MLLESSCPLSLIALMPTSYRRALFNLLIKGYLISYLKKLLASCCIINPVSVHDVNLVESNRNSGGCNFDKDNTGVLKFNRVDFFVSFRQCTK